MTFSLEDAVAIKSNQSGKGAHRYCQTNPDQVFHRFLSAPLERVPDTLEGAGQLPMSDAFAV